MSPTQPRPVTMMKRNSRSVSSPAKMSGVILIVREAVSVWRRRWERASAASELQATGFKETKDEPRREEARFEQP